MKIYLFLNNKIVSFSIPTSISGSYSFDENPDEEEKLINIEARGNGWVLYSTVDSKVLNNGQEVQGLSLRADMYYIIRRKNINYLIFVTNILDNSFSYYSYADDINLVLGNGGNCNINYRSGFVKENILSVNKQGNMLVLNSLSNLQIYINNKALKEKVCPIKIGDCINIYGLKIIFLNGLILINNPQGAVTIGENTNLKRVVLNNGEQPQDYEIKDTELYSKDSYYSKSPRIRRLIKTKEIQLSQPPKLEGEKEMPMLLTIGPMFTMGLVSVLRVFDTFSKVLSGTTTVQKSWVQLATSGAMLLSSLLWPNITKHYNKKMRERKNKEILTKYTKYLDEKKNELQAEQVLQKEILEENLVSVDQCLKIIDQAKLNFWDKRIEQSDFLELRVGKGNIPLDAVINFPKEGFTIEEDALKKKAQELVDEFKNLSYVPVGYSFYKNKITAVMGDKEKSYGLLNNLILQLITFYSYEDVKLILFTNEANEDKWNYIKYLNHNFTNDKAIRFYSTNVEDAKRLSDYIMYEVQNRIQQAKDGGRLQKPYYVIICDDYSQIKRLSFTSVLTELDVNLGFSFIILENQMSKLPSKCNNFITLGNQSSGILINAFEEQKQITFHDEINNNIDMLEIARKLSNIPIEFEEGNKSLPDSVTFLEMEKVGKVEQLNIMNRWQSNDSTQSLKAEVGVDSDGDLIYLDLHEKFHGPHGLIAGMTGSGKSEFIITYILAMATNYSPDDVAFILIDYKGGGLAGAFENKTTGISLPHLAGTITNLDKAEMDRTLVSIDSEVKRRQKIFNEARDQLGESTIDIYKYQRFYHEGKLAEPVPHLFIICDEFAELKSQQPEFMDNLISVARIGRSLGVHLILATQKPSGVVNDQIWSNTKFRVCLKVQNTSDSNEMLKRPEAASIKQTGRFYLQVGYDELFLLGQSGWCGAKYYPSDKIIKNVDKSVNFIGDTGDFIKSIQAGNNIKIEAQGEQLAAIMKNIIEVAKLTNKKTKRLWLNDIEPIILINNLEKKYNFVKENNDVKAIIGEYDAPENQEQGLLEFDLNTHGNTLICGNDEVERENLLKTIIYSMCKNYSANEINIYGIDFGSESLRAFSKFPQVGGFGFLGEDEIVRNAIKLIKDEINNRKKILVDYGGSLDIYNSKNENKLPQILFIFNNYEAIQETYNTTYELISSISRDCMRYGIFLIITCANYNGIGRRVTQNFENKYALHLTDQNDYYSIFNRKIRVKPRNNLGRGLVFNNGIHEFQTASIVGEDEDITEFLSEFANSLQKQSSTRAPQIPSLPEKITLDLIENQITTLDKVPIGISKNTLKPIKFDFKQNVSTIITSNKIQNLIPFVDSLVDVLLRIQGLNLFFIDALQLFDTIPTKNLNGKKVNYINDKIEDVFEKLNEFQSNPENNKYNFMYIISGMEKIKNKSDTKKLETFFTTIKASENANIIIIDGVKILKGLDFDQWFAKVKNQSDGIWIGKGINDQQFYRISKMTKEMTLNYPNNYGFCIRENDGELMKVLEFNDMLEQKDDENEE